jgi:hypothetical protein
MLLLPITPILVILYITVPSVLALLLATTALCYYHHAKSKKHHITKVDVESGSDFSSGPQETALQRFERDLLSEITMVNNE